MGWLPTGAFENLKIAAESLTANQRAALTWEQAGRFVAADTLEMAHWEGLKESGLSPWDALKRLKRIEGEPPAPEVETQDFDGPPLPYGGLTGQRLADVREGYTPPVSPVWQDYVTSDAVADTCDWLGAPGPANTSDGCHWAPSELKGM